MSLEDQFFKLIKEIEEDRHIGDKRAEQFWNRTRVGQIGTPTYSNFVDWLSLVQSAGKLSEGVILSAHAPANGTLDVAAGPGFIKTTDSPIGLTKFFDWGAVNLALDDGVTSYIYVDYSLGTPAAKATTTRADIEMNRMFTLGRVFRDGNLVHVVNSGTDLTNTARRNHERLIGVRGFERDSGGVISESGERYLESTAGVFWLGANEILTLSQNTNNGDRFTKWFHVGGAWDSTGGQQQVDNSQYDDGSDLQNLTVNKYGTMWCYIDYDSHLQVVYGLLNGTLTQARAADPPDVPAFIRDFAILAARIIVQQGTANIIEFKSAYEVFFPHTTPSEHNDMGSLQGGTADQYYHLTAAQHGAHVVLPGTIADVLSDHAKAAHDALGIDAETVDGEDAADIVTNARVKAHFPDTIVNVLSNHTKAVHDALNINAGLVDGFSASQVRNSANTCAVRDAAGYLQLGWINTTSGVASSAQPVRIYCSQDAYIRYMTAANFRLWMSLYTKAEINAALDLTNKTIKTTAKARVYRVGVQHDIVHATPTKVLCGGENFDPGNNWDPVTNFRFTAPVTGYYSVTGAITYVSTVANKLYECHLCKNGAAFAKGAIWLPIASTVRVLCSDIVYLTATQYIELYANHYAGVDTVDVYGDVADTYIAIHLLSV